MCPPVRGPDDGLDGPALPVSAPSAVGQYAVVYRNGHIARVGAGRGLAFVTASRRRTSRGAATGWLGPGRAGAGCADRGGGRL